MLLSIFNFIKTNPKAFVIISLAWWFRCQLSFAAGQPVIQPFLGKSPDLRIQTWAITTNPENGYVYFAQSGGITEFNGISHTHYLSRENRPVRAIQYHPDGRIYTGSFEEFGYWQHSSQGRLEYTSLTSLATPVKNDEIWKIYSSGNDIFFQSFTTIYRYNGLKADAFKAPYTMLFMHQVGTDFVVQIIDQGLFYFRNGDFVKIEGSEIFRPYKVHAIIPFDNTQWLICTDKQGLFLYNGNKFQYSDSEASRFLKLNNCNAAIRLSDSTVVFGSILNGLILTDNKGNILRHFTSNNGLYNNTILSFYADMNNGLWAGLDEGVNYIALSSPVTRYTTQYGTLGTIYALLRKDNNLYIGTNHGLFVSEIQRKGSIYHFGAAQLIPASQGQVWTLTELNGQIICGHNEGTFLVIGNRLENISTVTGGWVYTSFNEYLLGGTYTGITLFDKDNNGTWRFRDKIEGLLEPIRYLEADYLGYVWATHHQKGVFKIELNDDLSAVSSIEHISSIDGTDANIKVFRINNRVVFTTGKDIYTWDFVRNQIVRFEILNQHLGEYVNVAQISHFRKNQYWFIVRDKIALFEIGPDFSARRLSEFPHRLASLPQRTLQIIELDENTIIKPNHQNFDLLNLSKMTDGKPMPGISFEKIQFYGFRDTLVFYKNFPREKIPARMKNLRVFFADPSAITQYPASYSFRIKELDPTWQTTTTGNFTYLDVKHGKYTVEIRDDSGTMISFAFDIDRPWYLSNLAWLLYMLAFSGVAWGLYAFFRFEVNRQKELAAMGARQTTLEKELDFKSYELLITLRNLLQKENLLTDLKNEIESVKLHSAKYPVKHIKNMEKIIEQGIGTQHAEWENAMNNLKLSEQGFFRVLKRRFPELTSHDLRLCSYLRLNFNSKEIAGLLNISVRSVEISRHRLRKKLHLANEQNLFDFLLTVEADESE